MKPPCRGGLGCFPEGGYELIIKDGAKGGGVPPVLGSDPIALEPDERRSSGVAALSCALAPHATKNATDAESMAASVGNLECM